MTPDKLPPPDMGELVFGLVPLREKAHRGAYRYAIYLMSPAVDLGSPLWGPYTPPETSEAERKRLAPKTWPGMVYNPMPREVRDTLPAWHFALDFPPAGWGTDSAAKAFAHELARHLGRPISLRVLHGWNSTTWKGVPPAKKED